jgi:DNA-directed RNA polymerase specialized sigma24 family protein
MGEHLDRKHAVQRLEENPDVLRVLIEQCALSDMDKQMLMMVHFKDMDQNCIADFMGMSVQNMRKRYVAAVLKLYRLAVIREYLQE